MTEPDSIIYAAVQKGIETHRQGREHLLDLLDLPLPAAVREAIVHRDLAAVERFVTHPGFGRVRFRPDPMELALTSGHRPLIDLLRLHVEPYRSLDPVLFKAVLDRDHEALERLALSPLAEADVRLANQIELTFRMAHGVMRLGPTGEDELDTWVLKAAIQPVRQPEHEQAGYIEKLMAEPDPEETMFLLRHLAQRYGLIKRETMKWLLINSLPRVSHALRKDRQSPEKFLRLGMETRLELFSQLIQFVGDLRQIPDLVPELVFGELNALAARDPQQPTVLPAYALVYLLPHGGDPDGLFHGQNWLLTGQSLNGRTALDIAEGFGGENVPYLRQLHSAGAKRAHELRREHKPLIDEMLADLR